MLTFLALLGGLYVAGALTLVVGMRKAPEGYENEVGFQLVWQNNEPELQDVACVWAFSAAHAQA